MDSTAAVSLTFNQLVTIGGALVAIIGWIVVQDRRIRDLDSFRKAVVGDPATGLRSLEQQLKEWTGTNFKGKEDCSACHRNLETRIVDGEKSHLRLSDEITRMLETQNEIKRMLETLTADLGKMSRLAIARAPTLRPGASEDGG